MPGGAEETDARLEKLGAKRVSRRQDCDVEYEEPYAGWLDAALKALAPATHSGITEVVTAPVAAPVPAVEYGKKNPFPSELLEKVLLNGQVVSCFDNSGTPSGSCTSNLTTLSSPSFPVIEKAVKELKVAAYPNPYFSTVSFKFVSPLSGQASLEVFDILGRKLAVIFEGNVDAGMERTIKYKVPSAQRVPMIYRFRVGDKISYGKLLPMDLF